MVVESSGYSERLEAERFGTATRLPTSAIISASDAAVLLAAVVLAGDQDWLAQVYGVLAFVALLVTGAHRERVNAALDLDVPWLLARLALPLLLVAGPASAVGAAGASLARLAWTASVAAILVPVGRGVSYAAIRALRRRGHLLRHVLIVGADQVGAELARILQEHREYGLFPVGFADAPPGRHREHVGMPVLGDPSDAAGLAQTVERSQVSVVVIAFGALGGEQMTAVLRACERLPIEVYVVPRFFDAGIAPAGLLADDVWGIPLIRLRRPALRPTARLVKRAFDVVVAGVGLLGSAPLLLAVAVAVRASSPGPVLFRQRRIGRDGRPFELLKFRTMTVNQDADTTWSVEHDGRVTRVGRFLRRTCLDELPQLVNVLRGEMSLVGPRPERPFFAHRFSNDVPRYDDRHRVLTGMTGWAQVHGLRGDTPIPDRVRFDNYYIEHWSLWVDLVVLVRTLVKVVTNRW